MRESVEKQKNGDIRKNRKKSICDLSKLHVLSNLMNSGDKISRNTSTTLDSIEAGCRESIKV
jgi:hypothetical protein